MTKIIHVGLSRLERASFPFAARLTNRVKELVDLYHEDYASEPCMAALADIVEFFELAHVREYTFLTLTPEGDWYFEWRLDEHSKLAVEFAANGIALLFSSRPNARHPERLDIYSGTTTSDSLADSLVASHPLKALAA
jgi:hypothetical protein